MKDNMEICAASFITCILTFVTSFNGLLIGAKSLSQGYTEGLYITVGLAFFCIAATILTYKIIREKQNIGLKYVWLSGCAIGSLVTIFIIEKTCIPKGKESVSLLNCLLISCKDVLSSRKSRNQHHQC